MRVLGGRAPQTTPWGPGRGREGGGTATARPPGYSPRRGPRSTTTCGRAFQCPIVVLVGRPRRSAASADRQVRWRALAVVPCRHKLTGWKEAVMGGGRGAGGQEGGMALAEERRSSPKAHPSLPPSLHSRKIWQWSYVTDGSFNPWWKGTWWKQAGTAPPQPLLGTVIHGPPRPGDTVIHGPPRPGESSSSAWAPSGGCSPTYSPY